VLKKFKKEFKQLMAQVFECSNRETDAGEESKHTNRLDPWDLALMDNETQ